MPAADSRWRKIFAHQIAHFVWLALLLAGLFALGRIEGFWSGRFLGLGTGVWVALAVADAIAHQVFVWFCWRIELHGGLMTRLLGKAAFGLYAAVFAVLIIARPVLVTALAISNAGTLAANPTVTTTLAIVLAIPVVYLAYSMERYFSYKRAFGIDHFDPAYRTLPIVRQGIFRYSSNSMYVFGFLALWIPGLLANSTAALAVALFSHAYIWVHYFCTEKPDMQAIYGDTKGSGLFS